MDTRFDPIEWLVWMIAMLVLFPVLVGLVILTREYWTKLYLGKTKHNSYDDLYKEVMQRGPAQGPDFCTACGSRTALRQCQVSMVWEREIAEAAVRGSDSIHLAAAIRGSIDRLAVPC